MRVLGLGAATLDLIMHVEAFPEKNKKTDSVCFITQGGGNCANTLTALSRLGIETVIITFLGNDIYGQTIRLSLENENIQISDLCLVDDVSCVSLVIVEYKSATRTIIRKNRSDNNNIYFTQKTLQGVDVVFMESRFFNSSLHLAGIAHEQCLPICLNLEENSLIADVFALLKYITILFLSVDAGKYYFGTYDGNELKKRLLSVGVKIIVLTNGSEGSSCFSDEEDIHLPVEKQDDIVDTTGAGDAFAGGFIFGYLQKKSLYECMLLAHTVASRKCKKPGAREGLPYIHEL